MAARRLYPRPYPPASEDGVSGYDGFDRRDEGLAIVDRLLRRNPGHAVALELQRQFR